MQAKQTRTEPLLSDRKTETHNHLLDLQRMVQRAKPSSEQHFSLLKKDDATGQRWMARLLK